MFVGYVREEMLVGEEPFCKRVSSPTPPPPKTFMAFYRSTKPVGGQEGDHLLFFKGNLVYMPFSAMRQARSQTRQE